MHADMCALDRVKKKTHALIITETWAYSLQIIYNVQFGQYMK